MLRPFRSFALFVTTLLGLLGPALSTEAQEGSNSFEPLNPFESGSELLGLADKAPLVRYNEFTGDVSISMPAGVLGLQVPMTYSRDRLGQLRHYGHLSVPPGELGSTWHLGFGFIQAKKPYDGDPMRQCDENGDEVCSKAVGWTALVEPGGHVTDFHRDYLFQSLPDSDHPVVNESHWIDSSLRRIVRDRSEPFSYGPYELLDVDGTRTLFEPVYSIPSTSNFNFMRFYPTWIQGPDGRVITIRYGGDPLGSTLPAGAGLGTVEFRRPIEAVTDSWGRELLFDYYTPIELQAEVEVALDPEIAAYPRLKEVRISNGVGSHSLVAFHYTAIQLGGIQSVEPSAILTAEGYTTTFDYGGFPGHDNGTPLLERVGLATGGNVEMEYQIFAESSCQPGAPTENGVIVGEAHLRLKELRHGGETYYYGYHQGTVTTGTPADGELMVDVTTASDSYRRITTYVSPLVRALVDSFECQLWPAELDKPRGRLVGQPTYRQETYIDREGVSTDREEVWDYKSALLSSGDAAAVRRDAGALYAVVPMRYSQRLNGECPTDGPSGSGPWAPADVWLDTFFEYNLWPGLTDGQPEPWTDGHASMADGDFHRAVRIVRAPRDYQTHDLPWIEQIFDYQHRLVSGHDQNEVPTDREHALALPVLKEAWYHPEDGASPQPLGRSTTGYETDFESRTLPQTLHSYENDTDFIETRYAYYGPSHAYAGRLASERRGPVADAAGFDVLEWTYGQESRVVPLEGPETVRTVRYDGVVTEETDAGVTTTYEYDLDRRPVISTTGLDWPRHTAYSSPGVAPYEEQWLGFGSDQNQLQRQEFDTWGRAVRSTAWIDKSPFVEAGTTAGWNSLGLQTEATGVAGAATSSRWDVLGMEVETTTTAADGTPLNHRSQQHRARCDGTTFQRVSRRVAEADADVETRTTVTDLAGRLLRAGTGEAAYLASGSASDGGFTTFSRQATVSNGQSGIWETISPYDRPDRARFYDWAGKLLWEDHPETFRVHHEYDAHGRLARTIHSSDRSEEWTYDRADRFVQHRACDADGICTVIAELSYDPVYGGVSQVITDSGVTSTVTYDGPSGRPDRLTTSIPGLAAPPTGAAPGGEIVPGPVTLSWSPQAGAAFYQVQALRGDTVIWRANDLTTSFVFMPDGIWDGTEPFAWRVRSFDADYAPSLWKQVELSGGGGGGGGGGADGGGGGGSPELTVTPSTLSFGPVSVNEQAELSLTLSNVGDADAVGSIGGVTAPFHLASGATFALAPGGSTEVTLRFAPTAEGAATGEVTFTADGADPVTIALDGTGEAPLGDGEIDIPAHLRNVIFGAVLVDEPSTPQTLTESVRIRNVGTGPLTGLTASFDDPRFRLAADQGPSGWGTCEGIAAGYACYPVLEFDPAGQAGSFSGTATFRHSRPDGSVHEIPVTLSGDGEVVGVLEIQSMGAPIVDVEFGDVRVGQTLTRTFQITNTGTSSTYVQSSASPPFSSSLDGGTTLPAGNSFFFSATFSPTTIGRALQGLDITSSQTPGTRFFLKGTGVHVDLVSAVARSDFGTRWHGHSAFAHVDVTNHTTDFFDVAVTGYGDLAGVSPSSIFLSDYETEDVTLRITVPKLGPYSGRVCFEVEGQEDCVELSGVGVDADEQLVEPWAGAPYRTFLDPVTGLHVSQLTSDPGDHYVFAYHQPSASDDGRYVVYRYMVGNDPATLAYRLLELETGIETVLTVPGHAHAGHVAGNRLYVRHRTSTVGPYGQIRSFALDGSDGPDGQLLLEPAGQLVNKVSVNADSSSFLYVLLDPAQPDTSQDLSLRLHHTGDPVDGSLDTVILVGGTAPGMGVRDAIFHPTDPERFFFFGPGHELSVWWMGQTNPIQVAPLSSEDARFTFYRNFPTMVWGAGGRPWVNAVDTRDPVGHPELLMRLDVSFDPSAFGRVENHDAVELGPGGPQHSFVGHQAEGFFVGSGGSLAMPGGAPFLQLIRASVDGDPATTEILERALLAGSLGAEDQAAGAYHSNARLLPSMDAVLFSAPWDVNSGATDPVTGKHLFLVRLASRDKATLRDHIPSPGPEDTFRHGARAVASTTGWSVDDGRPRVGGGLGDGIADQTTGPSDAWPYDPSHYALADLDGDGVSERISLRPHSGGWRVYASLSRRDGRFADGAPGSDRFWAVDTPHPPILSDVDGDGRADVTFVTPENGDLRWRSYRNTNGGLPVVTASALLANGFYGADGLDERFLVADVNGDGYGDRAVIRPYATGWQWLVDFSVPGTDVSSGDVSWGDQAPDSSFIGGDYDTDMPLLGDLDGDGRADVVLARRSPGATATRWYVNPSNTGGLGSAWAWNGFFGGVEGQALVGTLGRFVTRD